MSKEMSQNDRRAAGGILGITALAAGAFTYWMLSDKKRRKKFARKINELKNKTAYFAEDVKDVATEKREELMG